MAFIAGGIQLVSSTGDADRNVAAIERLARTLKSREPGLALLAFPELALTGYSAGERFYELAERWPDSPRLARLSRLAAELAAVLVVGYAEVPVGGDRIYDAAAVFDTDGTPLISYRKTHCLDRERQFFANGDQLPLIPTALGTLGVMICWDAAFPEVARTYALAGADLLIVINAWEDPYAPDLDLVVSARAYDNVVPVLAVNRTGKDGDVTFSGHSRLVDCLGHPIATAGDEPDAGFFGSVDPEATHETREGYGSQLRDRRPELYGAVGPSAGTHGAVTHREKSS